MPREAAALDLGILPGLVGYRLRRAQLALYQDFLAACAPLALRQAQFAVLEILACNQGVAPSAVSAALGIKRTNFVPLFDELARRGLAERRAHPGDRRVRGLFLTTAGAELLARARAAILAHEARFAARLGLTDAQTLLALLSRAEVAAAGT
jgi:DNA-binding MarR family transcriptional regulator